MKDRMVHRYYCDYCKKAGCGKGAIIKHELHCTMNPNRVCRMCAIGGWEQPKMETLLAILPDGTKQPYEEIRLVMDLTIKELRRATKECPACMFAALRQAHLDVGDYAEYFDFSNEAREFINRSNMKNPNNYEY